VNRLVLSGTATVVPLGTRSSCYRGPESELTPWRSIPSSPRNFPNLESFGFLLTDRASRLTVDSDRAAKPHAPAGRMLCQKQSSTGGRDGYAKGKMVKRSRRDRPSARPNLPFRNLSFYKLRRTT
jgi:hypothetical protein